MVLRCRAYREADGGTVKMSEAESMIWRAKVTLNIPKAEKRKSIKDAKKLKAIGKKHFENAGFLFE